MPGIFEQAAREYHAANIPVFPVDFPPDGRKKPCTKNYQRVGLNGTLALAKRFPDANGVGFMCGERTGIVEIDIDDPSIELLNEALELFGSSPVQIETASGNRKLWYRWAGERRLIRPFDGLPIDILGNGMTVAPPSLVDGKGLYTFETGNLGALKNLPQLKRENLLPGTYSATSAKQKLSPIRGSRKNWLIRELLSAAHHCDSLNDLLDVAHTLNDECRDELGQPDPLSEFEVVKVAQWVQEKHLAGNNWVGSEARAVNTVTETLALSGNTRLYWFRDLIRQNHAARKAPFALDQRKLSEKISWDRGTVKRVIEDYLATGELVRIHEGRGPKDPHQYVLRHWLKIPT